MMKRMIVIMLAINMLWMISGCGTANLPASASPATSKTEITVRATPIPTISATPLPTDSATPGSAVSQTPLPTVSATPASIHIPAFEETKCTFEFPEGYQPKCGYLIVPEDRADPSGRKIKLFVAVFKNTGINPQPDPVIHLSGGPGASTLAAAIPILKRGGSEILKQRDYILFEQRGTQYSDPYLYCLPYDEYLWDAHEFNISLDEYNNGALPKLAACLENWREQGINLAAYNSAENAADVNDLRLTLGYEQVNLYGTSYGTRLALAVMRDFPEGIRSVILDSIYPPAVNLDLEIAANANRSMQEVFNACAAHDSCEAKYGDIEAKFYEVIDRLEAEPVQVETYGPYRDEPYVVYLDGDLFIDAMFSSLYSMISIADIPHLIQAAYEKSYDKLSVSVGGAIGSPLSTGLFWSTTCSEEVPFEIGKQETLESTPIPLVLLEHFTDRYTLNVCELWNVPAEGAVENEAVESEIPALLYSGRFDPVTPPQWARLAAKTLTNHYLYEFLNLSHGVMRSNSCALQMGLAFFDDPYHAPDSSCMNDLGSVEFH
jgi:pimeloyl-ACP methyl ester carboxylesterase